MGFPAEDEPDGNALAPHHAYVGILLTGFAFLFIWPRYPTTGAALSLLGTLILADDVISHAFGVWTPIDWAWGKVRPYLPST